MERLFKGGNLLWVSDEQQFGSTAGKQGTIITRTHTHTSYIELYDPEHGDEQEVKGDKEAEGPPHI